MFDEVTGDSLARAVIQELIELLSAEHSISKEFDNMGQGRTARGCTRS